MQNPKVSKLVWVDLEMTGLDLKKDKIIQLAALITDTDLGILDEKGYVAYVKISQQDIDGMAENVREMHTQNGLLEKSLKSQLTLADVDREVTEYISQFVSPNEAPLCGNTIGVDRSFIKYNMPKLFAYLHYRNIDVSTVKQLYNLWSGKEYIKPQGSHEALEDIKDSIKELKYYKEKFLKIP